MGTPYLITGAPGWLGTAFLKALLGLNPELAPLSPLRPGDEVRCLCLPKTASEKLAALHPAVRLFRGDVADGASLRPFFAGADGGTLFHIAGLIHPAARVAELFRVNVQGTAQVLAAAEAAGVRRLIHISSNSPIGVNLHRDQLFDESSSYNPYLGYGRSKMEGERLVQQAQARGRLETVILRPPWFYGPEQPPRQTLFFRLIKEGKIPLVGDGGNRRSMAYVDNISQGMLRAAAPKAAGQIYWIADRRPYTMNEIIDTVERLLEREFSLPCAHRRLRLPAWVGPVAGGADRALQALGLYQQKIHVLSEMDKTIACSIAKAERELGYRPAIELEEGMRRSIRWCLEQGYSI